MLYQSFEDDVALGQKNVRRDGRSMRVNASQDYSNPYNITTSPQNCILTSVAYKNISTLYASLYVFASVFLPLRIYPITMIGGSLRFAITEGRLCSGE